MTATSREGHASDADATMIRPLARPPMIGDVIADKYLISGTLGRGGMGRIFAAEHLMLHATVALKFMHPHLTLDPTSVARFAREARAAATLKSQHAARIIDVDQLPTGELYIVMEYLDGMSLESFSRDGRGLPITDAVTYIAQACEALAEAHDAGIVHRDVKPANLFLTTGKSGEAIIKLVDFGLAKVAEADALASGVTKALGTPRYMSPEQIGGARDLDGRSDVWSLGVTLYELLTGHAAFEAKGAMAIFTRILTGAPTPVRALRPEVPQALAEIIDRCLARDPAVRFSSVRELACALGMPVPSVASVAPAYVSTLVSPSDPAQHAAAAAPTELHVTWSSIAPAPLSEPRSTMDSFRPTAMSVGPESSTAGPTTTVSPGPSLGQTVIAALAGPALIAIAATIMAFGAYMSPPSAKSAGSPTPAHSHAVIASILTAKSGSTTVRAKAPAAPISARCLKNPRSLSCVAK